MAKTEHRNSRHILLTAEPDEQVRAAWDDLVRNASFATHYTTPAFFSDPFAGQSGKFAVLALEGGRVDAVVTGVRNGPTITCGMAVRPQTAFRDGCDRAAATESVSHGLAEMAGEDADLITLHSYEALVGIDQKGYECEQAAGPDRVVMLDLTKGPDELFKEFSERRRTDLRKVMRQGTVEVKLLETEPELRELYDIHKDWNRRKGNEPDPFESFQTILGSASRAIFIAIHEGKIVAGTYVRFTPGGVAEYAANNSLAEYSHLRANELLGWRAIEWACAAELRRFSMGASHPFLARYGGELFSSYRYRLDRTFLKRHANGERVSRLALKMYQRLPGQWRGCIKTVTAKA